MRREPERTGPPDRSGDLCLGESAMVDLLVEAEGEEVTASGRDLDAHEEEHLAVPAL
jgi:hypothetical protein